MDITSIQVINYEKFDSLEFILIKNDVQLASFTTYKNPDPEFHTINQYIFNAWDGDLSIKSKDNMLIFNHNEMERGHIKLYVNDPENKFWNIIQNEIKKKYTN
jgi:hypothetical protein